MGAFLMDNLFFVIIAVCLYAVGQSSGYSVGYRDGQDGDEDRSCSLSYDDDEEDENEYYWRE